MLEKTQNLPENLKNLLKTESYLNILLRYNSILEETEKLGKALKKELTKIGINEADFFDLMSKNGNV